MAVIYTTAAAIREICRNVTAAVLSDTKVEEQITAAENLINAHLGSRYAVPFSAGSVPPIISTLCRDLAAHYVMQSLYTRDGVNKSAWTEIIYTNAMDLLRAMQEGKIPVIDAAGADAGFREQSLESTHEDFPPVFDMDDTLNQGISSVQLEDIAGDRSDE